MASIPVEKSFCTTREAAILLGVSVGTVQLWVESGLLQAWKTSGGHRRVLRDSLDRLLHKSPQPTPLLPPSAVVNEAPLDSSNRRFRVMVVDDDPNLLRLYQVILASWPMQPLVTCLDNAVAALMMLGRGGPDLLIADLHMPGMDGFNMLRVLSHAPEMTQTKVVVVSGLDAAAIAARGGLPEGLEILSKPVPFDRLQQIAAAVFANKRKKLLAIQ
jgi:excisionase family DNA binding protein